MSNRAVRAFRRAFGWPSWPTGGVVLLYHRVTDLASDPQCLAVSPAHFADHLDVIRADGVLMPLEELVDAARQDRVPPRAIAVTFDDGYEDNFRTAASLLADAQAPATIFVSTGTLEHGGEFWWDEIDRLVLQPGTLPRLIRLQIGDRAGEWDLTGVTRWTAADCARYSAWNVERGDVPTPRHRLYRDLCRELSRLTGSARDRVLAELLAVSGQDRLTRRTHRPLSAVEIAALAQAEQITIGSHTDSHSSLAHLAADEQQREIASGRRRLQSLTDLRVTTFAYPFGGSKDVSDHTVGSAREQGISIACCAHAGTVHREVDPLRIPRFVVRNWPPSEFRQRWSGWTQAN
jgi:peptidoglycan/xylan/chitin deacetylase (PgdA/CDA1 family)